MRKKLNNKERVLKKNAASKKWRDLHPEQAARSRIAWALAHPGYFRKKSREQYLANPKKMIEASKRCHARHPEKSVIASQKYQQAHPEQVAAYRKAYRKKYPERFEAARRKMVKKYPWRNLIKSAEQRSKKLNIPFNLTEEWAAQTWTGKCSLTGIPFIIRPAGKKVKIKGISVFAASLDRKRPKVGYIPNNCRFILVGLNFFKHTGTDSEMLKIARALVDRFRIS